MGADLKEARSSGFLLAHHLLSCCQLLRLSVFSSAVNQLVLLHWLLGLACFAGAIVSAQSVIQLVKFFTACSRLAIALGRWVLRALFHWSSDTLFHFQCGGAQGLGEGARGSCDGEVSAVVVVQVSSEVWLYLTLLLAVKMG